MILFSFLVNLSLIADFHSVCSSLTYMLLHIVPSSPIRANTENTAMLQYVYPPAEVYGLQFANKYFSLFLFALFRLISLLSLKRYILFLLFCLWSFYFLLFYL
jgi:hypothetical protein